MTRYKTKFIIQKYSEILGINFNKIFSPTVKYKFLKFVLAISILFKLLIK